MPKTLNMFSVLGMAAVTGGLVTTAASAQTTDEPSTAEQAQQIVNTGDGRCLSVDPESVQTDLDGRQTADVVIAECDDPALAQDWTVIDQSPGDILLVSALSDLHLGTDSRTPVAGDPIFVATPSGLHDQEWLCDTDSGQLYPKNSPDLALTAEGDDAVLAAWTGDVTQQWCQDEPDEPTPSDSPSPSPSPSDEPCEPGDEDCDEPSPSQPATDGVPADKLPTTGSSTAWVAGTGVGLAAVGVVLLAGWGVRRRQMRDTSSW